MKLAKWRELEGFTQVGLAAELGCSQSYISQIERARDPIVPGPPLMERIYLLTGGQVQPNDFYDLPQCGTAPAPEGQQASACSSIPELGVRTSGEGAEGREGDRSPADRAAA
jgi:transcriptional regulator with XRE-family HTH domain